MGSTFLMNAKGHSYIAVTYLKSTNPRFYIVTFAHKGHFNTMVDMKNIHTYNDIHVLLLSVSSHCFKIHKSTCTHFLCYSIQSIQLKHGNSTENLGN